MSFRECYLRFACAVQIRIEICMVGVQPKFVRATVLRQR